MQTKKKRPSGRFFFCCLSQRQINILNIAVIQLIASIASAVGGMPAHCISVPGESNITVRMAVGCSVSLEYAARIQQTGAAGAGEYREEPRRKRKFQCIRMVSTVFPGSCITSNGNFWHLPQRRVDLPVIGIEILPQDAVSGVPLVELIIRCFRQNKKSPCKKFCKAENFALHL